MLTFVSGNKGKFASVSDYSTSLGLQIKFYRCDLEEANINDIEFISRNKALQAYDLIKEPCFVVDSGFYIDAYPNNPGFPGAFVKRSNVSSDVDSLLEILKDVKNRNCEFRDCVTFYDGNNFYTFYSSSRGTLSYKKRGENIKKAKSNLWYIFIPEGYDKTLAQMSDKEIKEMRMKNSSATKDFLLWYANEYRNNLRLEKK